MYLAQELRADNDPNGNGQWLTVVYHVDPAERYAETLSVMDSSAYGCSGQPKRHAAALGYADSIELPSVRITKSDYHARERQARQRATWDAKGPTR